MWWRLCAEDVWHSLEIDWSWVCLGVFGCVWVCVRRGERNRGVGDRPTRHRQGAPCPGPFSLSIFYFVNLFLSRCFSASIYLSPTLSLSLAPSCTLPRGTGRLSHTHSPTLTPHTLTPNLSLTCPRCHSTEKAAGGSPTLRRDKVDAPGHVTLVDAPRHVTLVSCDEVREPCHVSHTHSPTLPLPSPTLPVAISRVAPGALSSCSIKAHSS